MSILYYRIKAQDVVEFCLALVFVSFMSLSAVTFVSAQTSITVSPLPGTTLSTGTNTFSWGSVSGATQYSIYMGTTLGGQDLGGANVGTGVGIICGVGGASVGTGVG